MPVASANRSQPRRVVGLGEALWDFLPEGKQIGGAPLNFAYISLLLGEQAIIASRIGADRLGAELECDDGPVSSIFSAIHRMSSTVIWLEARPSL